MTAEPIIWQEQAHDGGCGFAALGMLTDTPYPRVADSFPELKDSIDYNGLDGYVMFHYLAEQGYAVQIKREYIEATGELRKPWPPKPWADRHLVLVWQTKEDWLSDMVRYGVGLPYENTHYVVMDRKGICYDPADPEHKKLKLNRYHKVAWIAGVYKVT